LVTAGPLALAATTVDAPSSTACHTVGTGSVTSEGDNLADDLSCNLTQPSDHPATEPLLGWLGDHGGPSWPTGGPPGTHLPLPGSPLIDAVAGPCAGADQRGVARPQGVACDIGAVEVQADELASISVTTTADVVDAADGVLSLREAVDAANAEAGANQIVLTADATYELTIPGRLEDANATGDLDSHDDLTVVGNGATVDAGGLDRALDATGALVLVDVSIIRGDTTQTVPASSGRGGGVRVIAGDDASVVLQRVNVTQSRTPSDGGGLYVLLFGEDSRIDVRESSLTENAAGVVGGGAYLSSGGKAFIADSRVDGNMVDNALSGDIYSAAAGGGVMLAIAAATVVDSSFSDNVVDAPTGGYGGGIAFDQSEGVTLRRVSLVGNTGPDSGGGVGGDQSPITLEDSWVADNTVSDQGGGVWAPGELTLTRTTITNNHVDSSVVGGGGVVADIAHISGSTVRDNSAGGDGGGLLVGALEMSATTVSRNVSGHSGGGIALRPGSVATQAAITTSTIANNLASAGAGGIETQVSDFDAAPLSLADVTIAGNTGSVDGLAAAAPVEVAGSVIAGEGGPVCSGVASITSLGNNASTGSCGLDDASDLPFSAPLLGPLADNGGSTATRRPLPGSPLIDAGGSCGGTDQRGVSRPVGPVCDIGAVEANSFEPVFRDVPPTHPFYAEIECLSDLGATEGYGDGTFRGSSPITRQAVVAWLWRLAGEPVPAGDPPFSDVSASHPFADAIAWAAEEGLVHGYPDGTFRPGANVQRQALAAWLWRQAGEPEPLGSPPFSDVSASHPFADAIAWLAGVGITNGYSDGTFRPGASITREAVAAWVCRADALVA
jgi:hypothetical protein